MDFRQPGAFQITKRNYAPDAKRANVAAIIGSVRRRGDVAACPYFFVPARNVASLDKKIKRLGGLSFHFRIMIAPLVNVAFITLVNYFSISKGKFIHIVTIYY